MVEVLMTINMYRILLASFINRISHAASDLKMEAVCSIYVAKVNNKHTNPAIISTNIILDAASFLRYLIHFIYIYTVWRWLIIPINFNFHINGEG
jgi:hypothetical protein